MATYNYSKYKILIDPESKKTQGLRIGDVVRRQYFDNPNLIYSLMIVLETGSEIVREKDSPYFIGALVEGDEPRQGELLDFVRLTNLFNSDRGGALYLTASDSQSPYMDVVDGMATEHSLHLQDKVKRIEFGEVFVFPINDAVSNPERIVISYKIRASKALAQVPLAFGYTDGSEMDGTDTVDVATEWQYKLSLITIDYPEHYPRQLVIAPTLLEDGWCEVSDLNIVRLSSIANFSNATKARIGKISGIIDPVFGLLEGYGAYFQHLYATRNVNIAGTLTAGDENGFASTFYVGKIHKNVIMNSVGALFTGSVPISELAPAGIGKVVRTDGDTELCVQSASWRMERIGKRYTFSLWIKGGEGRIALFQDEHYIQDVEIEIAGEWRRYKVSFIVETSQREAMYVRLETFLTDLLLTAPQLESGGNASQYQPTDEHLSYVEDYGAWFNKGGIGGTIQNPLLRLNEDGSISSRNGSFVINPDGTGHFSNGKFKWTQDDIELSDMTIRWDDLDEQAKEQILSKSYPDWVSDWDSGKTVIDGQSIITPKILAGTKNANGTLTGMAIGKFELSTQNSSGAIAKETVNGIYGFNDGKKTFEVNATGSVQLGNGNEYIKYSASAGKVEFGSAVALAWVGATYIDANGVFTGTLSANTVNAVSINASQITAGTISADRIDVNALKASLITAGNIEALTLNVTKGKIGSWIIDALAIYRGVMVNTLGSFTTKMLDITIGSAGIRGHKWRFEALGSGAIAGDNISWDMQGNVTFSEKVKLVWMEPIGAINTALGGDSFPKLTQISSTGIYTGTLNASQITAGTIDAERLNVDALKASLITAENIEALTLNVKSGTIGGWTINADSISNERILLDNATNRIVVYGSSNSSVGRRVQLYYTSNTDYGFLTTDLLGGSIVQLGTVNKIAGWTISSLAIFKNNVYLGSNGSIYNSTKWRFDSDGSGLIASGNIAWDLDGNVTFASSVSLQWSGPIGVIKNALGGEAFSKLTYISSTGIYTGTLTANQVNAVGISASSITTGTLNADRIAAGSINATKLDAISIKTSIINTDYINGLSCTFVRGKIGGFVIGGDNMTAGSLGATGQTPIQIRTTSSGSGYWYTCEYKPFGIAMTWHQSANAGHIVFGQIAASGNTVKTGFVGIQMMSWDNVEYFCLSANYTRTGSKEVYNRIAGWAFDNASIWKNSVYLGSDGSIYNGNKWRLNNDGSGRVANGNIVWDAAGNVTFGSSVSLQWSSSINSITNALGGGSFSKLTKITSDGIYTGTLTASQINAGTISADRIAAGSITSSKLDAASIKANIINTSYINGLSCTFDRGTIGGWQINSYQIYKNSVALSSDGSIVNGSRWRLNNDGSGQLANGNIYWDAAGNVTARGAVFNNVRIQGSVRNPFVLNDSSVWIGGDTANQQSFNNYDNIVAIRGSWDENITLPWTLANSGRRITLVNYRWGSNTTVGYMTIYAPYGKYFYEDGLQKSSISFSREFVELLGYGDSSMFFGWIVVNRRDLMTTKQYGAFTQVMYNGYVANGNIVKQKGYDGGRCSCSRLDEGLYRVNMPINFASSDDYTVMLTGFGTVFATIHSRYSSFFEVRTADDASPNDGNFIFQVIPMGDWT